MKRLRMTQNNDVETQNNLNNYRDNKITRSKQR